MHRATEAALLSAATLLVFAVPLGCAKSEPAPTPKQTLGLSSAAVPGPPPGTFVDPLVPARPVSIDAQPRAVAADWVRARPGFQTSLTAAQRGGVEPCAPQPVDVTGFESWAPIGQGKFSVPRALVLDENGGFDLIIHLLGDEPIRRELILSEQPFALYSLTIGTNQSYAPLFTGSAIYASIIAGVEQALSKRAGKPAHVRHLAMSAWSAGFVGIEAALAQPFAKDIDALILIDGLHAPRNNPAAFKAQMKPFVEFAAKATRSERAFVVSHSSIDPPDFASTTECAHYLISSVGGKPRPVKRADPLGLELVEYFTEGDFHVRGYAGNDKADHCAQLAVLRDGFVALGTRWKAKGLSR